MSVPLVIFITSIRGAATMTDVSVDRAALADLRPGAAMVEVAKAYGSAWKAPLPHREGYVVTIDFTDGVMTRFTREGKLGYIRFNWRFGKDIPVHGVYNGAAPDALTTRFPGLDLKPLSMKPFAWLSYEESPHLHIQMEIGATFDGKRYLRWIELSDLNAVYPEKQPITLPPPTGEPGTPFKDVNLKLAVLSNLIERGHIDIGEPQDLYDHVLSRPFDLEEEGYDPVPEALDYLARYPLTEELLAKVTSLETDGGSEIYRYIEYFWDGETDDYTISSLDGIEALVNLKRVRFISMVHDDIDRTPLKRLGIEVK